MKIVMTKPCKGEECSALSFINTLMPPTNNNLLHPGYCDICVTSNTLVNVQSHEHITPLFISVPALN